jgi:hypothetical protein
VIRCRVIAAAVHETKCRKYPLLCRQCEHTCLAHYSLPPISSNGAPMSPSLSPPPVREANEPRNEATKLPTTPIDGARCSRIRPMISARGSTLSRATSICPSSTPSVRTRAHAPDRKHPYRLSIDSPTFGSAFYTVAAVSWLRTCCRSSPQLPNGETIELRPRSISRRVTNLPRIAIVSGKAQKPPTACHTYLEGLVRHPEQDRCHR